jgi:hypothetical protein
MSVRIDPLTGRPVGQGYNDKVNSKTILDNNEDDWKFTSDPELIKKYTKKEDIGFKIDPDTRRDYVDNKMSEIKLAEDFSEFTEYDATVNTFNDFRDNRAYNQPTGEKWANSFMKMGTLATTTFFDGTIGTLVGLSTAISEGRPSAIWDNPFSNWMVDIQEDVEKNLPNYYTNVEQASPWYNRLGTANFWGDTIVKNFGFAIGALAAGFATGVGTELGLSKAFGGKSMMRNLGKALGKNPDEVLRLLKSQELSATTLGLGKADDAGYLLKQASKVKGINTASEITGSVAGAIGEGRIEAINSSREYYNKLRSQGLTDGEAQSRAIAHGNVVFGLNVALLTAGNYAQFRNAFGGGYRPNRLSLASIDKNSKGIYEATKANPFLAAGKVMKNPIIEGLEEMNQLVIQKGSEEYINRKHDPLANESANTLISSLIDGMGEAYGSAEGWENFVAGFITGGVGIVNAPKLITQGKFSLEGGIREDIKDIRSQNKKAESLAKAINKYIEDGGVESKIERMIRDISYQQTKDKALVQGDEFKYKNAENSQIINMAMDFIEAGKMDELISDLENWKGATADELKKLSEVKDDPNKEGTPEEGVEKEPVHNPYENKDDATIEREHRERIDRYIQKIKDVAKASEAIDVITKGSLSKDLREKLIHNTVTTEDLENRAESLRQSINEKLTDFKTTDSESFEESGRKKISEKVIEFERDIANLSKKFTNTKDFKSWRNAFEEYTKYKLKTDKEFKKAWHSGLRQQMEDLVKIYEQRNELIDDYIKTIGNKEDAELELKRKEAEIKKIIRDYSLKLEGLNVAGEANSFFTDNTEEVEIVDPITGNTDTVTMSKTLKVKTDDGVLSSVSKAQVAPIDTLEEPEDGFEEIDEEEFEREFSKLSEEEQEEVSEQVDNEEKRKRAEEEFAKNSAIPIEAVESLFEIKRRTANGNVVLEDQNGNKAYFNKDGTFSYLGEVYTNFSFEEVSSIEQNKTNKKKLAKLNALSKYLIGAESRFRTTEKELAQVDKDLKQQQAELKKQKYLQKYTKKGETRKNVNRVAAKAIMEIERSISTLSLKKQKLESELESYRILYEDIKTDISLTKEREYVSPEETQAKVKAARETDAYNKNIGYELKVLGVDSFDEVDRMMSLTEEAINLLQEKIDDLKKTRDAYVEKLFQDRSPDSVLEMDENELSDYIWKQLQNEKYEKELKDIDNLIYELEEKLADYNKKYNELKSGELILRRIEFVEKYYDDLKQRALNEYNKLLGAKFSTGINDKVKESDKNREDEIDQKRDLSSPKHVFTGDATDFLYTMGGDEKPEKGSPSEKEQRWFDFVHENKTAEFIAYSRDNITEELKGEVEFYKGDKEEIIIVAVDKKGKPIKKDGKVVYASLAKPNFETAKKFDRFSTEKFKREVRKELKKNNPKLSDKEINEAVEEELQEAKERAVKDYNELRNKILTGDPVKMRSLYRTPGFRNENASLVEAKGSLFNDEKEIGKISLVIADTENYSVPGESQQFNTKPGHVYIYKDGRLMTVYEKRLGETEDTDRVIRLMKKMLELQSDKEGEKAKKIYYHLKSILYFSESATNEKYRLFVNQKTNRVHFGKNNISAEEFESDPAKVDELFEFLNEKYHNVNSYELKNYKTKYKVLDVDENNEVVSLKEFKNYKYYLMSDEGASKFLVNAAPSNERQSFNRAYGLTNNELDTKRRSKKNDKAYDGLYDDDEDGGETGGEVSKDIDTKVFGSVKKLAKNQEVKTSADEAKAMQDRIKEILKDKDADEYIEKNGADRKELASLYTKLTQALKGTENEISISDEIDEEPDDLPEIEEDEEEDDDIPEDDLETLINSKNLFDSEIRQIKKYIKDGKIDESTVINVLRNDKIANDDKLEDIQAIIESDDSEGFFLLASVKRRATGKVGEKELKWYDTKFGKIIPAEKIKGLIDGNKYGKFTKDLRVLFSEYAIEGTMYHEAFHAVTQVFLTEEQRKELYDEVRKGTGSVEVINEDGTTTTKNVKKLTDREVEEFLAEEFREYMISGPELYKFGKANSLKKNFFQKVVDFVKDFFGNFKGETSVDIPDFFRQINETESFDEKDMLVESITQDFSLTKIQTSEGEETIKQEEFSAYMDDFKARFNNILFKNPDGMGEINIENLASSMSEAYIKLKTQYRGLRNNSKVLKSKTARLAADNIYRNFEMLVDRHTAILKGVGVDFRVEDIVTEDNKLKDTYQYDASVSVSQQDITPVAVKLLIAGLPQVQEGKKIAKTKYMTIVVERYNSIMNTMYNNLAGLETYEQMSEKLMELSNSIPSMELVLNWMGRDNTNVSPETFKLRSLFLKAFSKNQNKPLLIHIREDNINFIDAVSQSIANALADQWKSNIRTKNYPSYSKKGKVLFKEFSGDIASELSVIHSVLNKAETGENGLTPDEKLALFGIHIPANWRTDERINNQINNLLKYLKREVGEIYKNTKNKKEIIKFDDFFDRDKIAINKEIQELAGAMSELNHDNIELVYFNGEGKREYAVTLNSHLSNTVNRINRGDIPKTLKPYDSKSNPDGNLVTTFSKELNRELPNISFELLRGSKARFGEGNDTSSLKASDYESMTANAVLHGKGPYLRSADRKMEYAISNSNHNNNFTEEQMIDNFVNYLKSTLVSNALATRGKGIWGKLKKFLKANNSLGYFDFLSNKDSILTKLNEELSKYSDLSNDNILKAIDRTISSKNKAIRSRISEHIREISEATEDRLVDSKIFVKDSSTSKYFNIGISDNLFNGVDKVNGISSALDLKGRVTEEVFKKTARALAVNYVFGAFEQTMLFTGDIRHYVKQNGEVLNWTDFHKRTTGAASTKYNSIVGGQFEQQLNEFYPRLDGKTDQNRRTINKLVYNELKDKVYGDKFEVESADGQGEMTLDEYRDALLRNADWTNEAEVIWQYEQQKFFAEAIEGNWDEDTFNVEKFKELFPETTYNGLETIPVYKGQQINEYDFETTLAPIKPQGFGSLEVDGDFGNSNIPQFSKLSIAPIIPSGLSLEEKQRLAKMVSAKIGFGVFESGEKAEQIKDKVDYTLEGVEDLSEFSQEQDYSGFGIQLDVDPSGKSKATYATQNGRLLLVNYISKELNNELKEIRESIVGISKRKLFRGLGVEGTKTLSIKDKKKFRNKIIESFKKREMPMNLVEGLDDMLKNSEDIIFDTLMSKKQIESILHALIRKQLIATKVNGDMLVQQAQIKYDNDLKFYRKGENFEDGILEMEVIVSVPEKIYKSRWFQDLDYKGLRGTDALNQMIEDNALPPEVLEFAGNRVPASDLDSLDYVKIKKFLPYHYGPTIIIPKELLIKNGSDFDVDKLNAYFYNYSVNKNGIVNVNDYKSLDEYWKDNKDSIIKKEDRDYYDKNIRPAVKEVRKKVREKRKKLDSLFEKRNLSKITSTLNNKTFEEWNKEFNEYRKEYIEYRDNAYSSIDGLYDEWKDENEQLVKDIRDIEKFENKLVEMQKKALLSDQSRYDLLVSPPDPDKLKELAGEPSKKITGTDLLQWTYNSDVAKANWSGQAGVGQTAVQVVSHASTQQNNVSISDPSFNINIEGYNKAPNEEYYLGHIQTSDGRDISNIFNQFLQAFVDVAKDNFVGRLNAARAVFPVYAMLIRTGTESGKPMSIDDAVKFLTQPIILEYIKRRDAEESAINQARNKEYKTKNETVEELFGNSDLRFKRNSSYKNHGEYLKLSEVGKITFGKDLSSQLVTEKDLMGETVQDREWRDDFSPTQLDAQAKVLNQFLILQEHAKQLSLLNQITRPDAGFPSSRAELLMQRKRKEMVLDSGYFNRENVETLLSESYLSAMDEVHESSRTWFDNLFITTKNKKVKALRENLISKFLSPKFGYSETKLGDIARKIEEDILTYMVLTSKDYESNKRISDEYEEMIMSSANSVAQELAKIQNKEDIKDNKLVKEFQAIINQVDTVTKENVKVDNLKTFSKTNRVEDVNELYSSFRELFENPKYKQLAEKIAKLTIIQSGFSYSNIDFKNIVPEIEMRPILERLLDKSDFNIQFFEEQFFRNNFNDEDIVPNVNKKPDKKGKIVLVSTRKQAESDYISSMVKDGDGYKKVLLKKTDEIRKVKGDEAFVYEIIETLGVPNRFKEYYPEANPTSLLNDKVVASKSEWETNFNPTNVSEKRREEYANYVVKKVGNILNVKQTVEESEVHKGYKKTGKIDVNIYDVQFKSGNVKIFFEGGQLGFGEKTTALKKAFEEDKINDIKFLVGAGKLIEEGIFKKGELFALEETENITDTPVSEELINSTRNFLKAIDVNVNTVEQIMDNKGRVVNASGIARLWNMTIDVVDGKRGINQLPEEAAHFYLAMLPKDHSVRKALVNNAHKYDMYEQVREKYFNMYADTANPEELVRLEVAGKVVAEEMKAIDQGVDFEPERGNIIQRMIKSIMKFLGVKVKKSRTTPYTKAALAVMNSDLNDLMETPDPNILEMFGGYTQDRLKWLSESQESRRKYETRITYSKRQKKKSVASRNTDEVSRAIKEETNVELSGIDAVKAEIFNNFEKYFPAYRNLNDDQKNMFLEEMTEGELEIYC